MNEFSTFEPTLYPLIMNVTGDTEDYIKNMDSDTRAYVLRNINEDSTIYDIDQCIHDLKG